MRLRLSATVMAAPSRVAARRLGPALACQRRHERHVATQRLAAAKRSGPVHDKVEAAAIGGVDITC